MFGRIYGTGSLVLAALLKRILIHPPSLKSPDPSPCETRAGRGAPSAELSRSLEIPSPLPSPHSSVVGRGNRRPVGWWYHDAPALLGALGGLALGASAAELPSLPIVKNVEMQPLVAQVRRVM